MDGSVWIAIITAATVGVGGILTSVITLVVGYKERKRQADREDAKIERDRVTAFKVDTVAKKAEEVKSTLEANTKQTDAKLDEGLKINRATHQLVNKETSDKLHKIRDKCVALLERDKRILSLTSNEADRKAVEVSQRDLDDAERMLNDHLVQQAKVNEEFGEAAARDMGTDRIHGPASTKTNAPNVSG